MNGKDLLCGMNHISDKLIEEASTDVSLRTRKRPGIIVLIAAIISVSAIVAFASSMPAKTSAWFLSFFGYDTKQEAQLELTENQSAILDAGLVEINQSVTYEGYTITLESGLCDGYKALIKCRVDAPEGISLNGMNYALEYESNIEYSGGNPGNYSASSYTGYPIEDEDPYDNSITQLLDIIVQPSQGSCFSLADGSEWSFSFSGISYRNRCCMRCKTLLKVCTENLFLSSMGTGAYPPALSSVFCCILFHDSRHGQFGSNTF